MILLVFLSLSLSFALGSKLCGIVEVVFQVLFFLANPHIHTL